MTEVIHEKDNPFFGRKEIIIKIKKETHPNQVEIKKTISEKYSSDPKHIKIKKISAKYGTKEFSVSAFVYKSEEEKKIVEIKKKKDDKSSGHEVKQEVKK
ncbi:hypothetical protein HYT24_03075 [Candidatus Pacearchaeota archaeon]|nr:hypothetical protein [Candidatus Pacearchaeota archaeon]